MELTTILPYLSATKFHKFVVMIMLTGAHEYWAIHSDCKDWLGGEGGGT